MPLPELEKYAFGGKPEAQAELGKQYLCGENGLERDPETAFSWFSKSSAKNCPTGLYMLGLALITGTGTAK